MNQTQLQLTPNQPPKPMQLPTQPVANTNNRLERPGYIVDEGPSYPILPLQNIGLISSRNIHIEPSPPPVSMK